MNNFKITCTNGNYWTTGFNGTFDEAKTYFMGQSFCRELYDGTEVFDTVCLVEII